MGSKDGEKTHKHNQNPNNTSAPSLFGRCHAGNPRTAELTGSALPSLPTGGDPRIIPKPKKSPKKSRKLTVIRWHPKFWCYRTGVSKREPKNRNNQSFRFVPRRFPISRSNKRLVPSRFPVSSRVRLPFWRCELQRLCVCVCESFCFQIVFTYFSVFACLIFFLLLSMSSHFF